jgi:hypothetical protein
MRPSTVVRGPLFRARRRRLLRAARTRPDRSGFRRLAVAEPGQGRRGDAQDQVGAGNLDLVVHALTEEAAAQHPAQARWLRTRLRRLSDMASARHQTAAAPARSIVPEGQGDSSPPMADVGVLFVHGIGQQVQGETLYAWGGTLVQWLERWLTPRGGFLWTSMPIWSMAGPSTHSCGVDRPRAVGRLYATTFSEGSAASSHLCSTAGAHDRADGGL